MINSYEIDNELKEIVELTPDSQGNVDWVHYDKVEAVKGGTSRADKLMFNDLMDSTDMLYSYLKNNPSMAEKYGGNLVKIVDSVYGDKLVPQSKKDVVYQLQKRNTLDVLSLNTEEVKYELPDLFHGTGSSALEGISREGKLLSEAKLKEMEVEINTGEGYLDRKQYFHNFVSFQRFPMGAINTHAYIDGISKIGDFPVVIGFDESKVDEKSGVDSYTSHFDKETGEVCIKDEVSLDAATHIFAPFSMKEKIQDFVNKYNLDFIPIEDLQKKSGLEFGVRKY